jgi:hypothetical protein
MDSPFLYWVIFSESGFMIDVGEEKKWVRESERILLGFWDRYVTDFDSRRLDWIDRSVERERYRDDRRKS